MSLSLTPEVLAGSVIAVPPLARNDDWSINRAENQKMIAYLEAGGISTLLYGGNANLYHIRLAEYGDLLALLADCAGADTVVIPSIGPSLGMMTAQVEILKDFDFPSVMVLPTRDAATSDGMATGIRHIAERYGKPIVLYVKHDSGLSPSACGQLTEDGVVAAIKYAIVLEDASDDPYLEALLERVDARIVVSGMGEQPAIVHKQKFGLSGFTSGCVCIAPALSQAMLQALNAGAFDRAEEIRRLFAPLEKLRNDIHPVRVLHEAVRLAGIADTGTLLPLLSNLKAQYHDEVAAAADRLLTLEQAHLNA